jgi:hypothetical protein
MTEAELQQLRTAVANYIYSEGCGCCEDYPTHAKWRGELAWLLNVPKWENKSGTYKDDFGRYQTILDQPREEEP